MVLALRVITGFLWALVLCMSGLWLILDWPVRFAIAGRLSFCAGVALFAMGQLVFVVVVADRVCPRASSRLTWPAHAFLAMLAIFALLALGVLVAVGGASALAIPQAWPSGL